MFLHQTNFFRFFPLCPTSSLKFFRFFFVCFLAYCCVFLLVGCLAFAGVLFPFSHSYPRSSIFCTMKLDFFIYLLQSIGGSDSQSVLCIWSDEMNSISHSLCVVTRLYLFNSVFWRFHTKFCKKCVME